MNGKSEGIIRIRALTRTHVAGRMFFGVTVTGSGRPMRAPEDNDNGAD